MGGSSACVHASGTELKAGQEEQADHRGPRTSASPGSPPVPADTELFPTFPLQAINWAWLECPKYFSANFMQKTTEKMRSPGASLLKRKDGPPVLGQKAGGGTEWWCIKCTSLEEGRRKCTQTARHAWKRPTFYGEHGSPGEGGGRLVYITIWFGGRKGASPPTSSTGC